MRIIQRATNNQKEGKYMKNNSQTVPEMGEILDLLVQTRDMCGNANEALREWEWENRKLSPEEGAQVRNEFSKAWLQARREARNAAK